MPAWIRDGNFPNVVPVGEVDDAVRYMQSKAILIVPLFSGSGLRIKIIEGMACAKTIVSTTIGAEGIDYTNGQNILVADNATEFADRIGEAVSDPQFCVKIGQQARNLIENQYNRNLLIRDLLAFYQKIGH
jgi:polysaccharide biosynthesis protein PslH